MFTSRQFNELFLEEVATTGPLTTGSITSGNSKTLTVACVAGNISAVGTAPATFQLGDILEVCLPPDANNPNGLIVDAWPTATQGTCVIALYNSSGAPKNANTTLGYTIVARRVPANIT